MPSLWVCTKGHTTEITDGVVPSVCPLCGFSVREGTIAWTTSEVFAASNGAASSLANSNGPSFVNKPKNQPERPAAHDTPPPGQLNSSGGSSQSSSNSSLLSNVSVPNYEILGELGRGGMGVVYKARQKGLNRIVALKMILSAEHAGSEQKARFQAEAEAVAQLHHVNIVQIYEVGEVDGRAYFSLEYVDGGSLASKIEGKRLTARTAASVLETIARGVAVAHSFGIIHRDLKPANVLLQKHNPSSNSLNTSSSGTGLSFVVIESELCIPKITDFGLAKRLEGQTGNTQTGAIMGTPSYMAPEQASGRIRDISPATDVYALGAILYEMLTGRPPFVNESPLETIMQVMRDEPVAPSRLHPRLPRDLEIICLKCLEKPINKRYANALELADDVHRFLEGEAISARPATRWEKTRRWVRRHPGWAGLSSISVVAIALMVGLGLSYHFQLQEKAEIADRNEKESHRRSVRLIVANGTQLLDRGDTLRALPYFAEALKLDGKDVQRREMHQIRIKSVLRNCPKLVQAWFHDRRVTDTCFSPDGKYVVSACEDGLVRIFLLEDTRDTHPKYTLEHPAAVHRIHLSPDGQQILSICADNIVRLWTLQQIAGGAIELQHSGEVTSARFSPDGCTILTTSRDRTAILWSSSKGAEIRRLQHSSPVLDGDFSPQSERVATAAEDGTARVWSVPKTVPVTTVSAQPGVGEEEKSQTMPHQGPITTVRFSPDGELLLTASKDQSAKIWYSRTGEPYRKEPIRRSAPLTDAGFSPNGRDITLAGTDGVGRVWNLELGDWRTWLLKHDASISQISFSPDGRSVATASDDNTAQVWEIVKGLPLTPPLRHNGTVCRAVFSNDSSMLLTASRDGLVRLWDIAAGRMRSPSGTVRLDSRGDTYSPNRRMMLRMDPTNPNRAQVCDAGTEQAVSPWMTHEASIRHMVFSPDGKRVLTTSSDRTARIWDSITGEPIGSAMQHGSDVVHAVFSPDGLRVATASSDNTARVWDWQKGDPVTPPLRHNATVQRVIFSPDGSCVLTSSEDGTSRVWDAVTGEALTPSLKGVSWVDHVLMSGEQTAGWDLPPDPHETEYLVALARWYSAHGIDNDGGLIPLTTRELAEAWSTLRNTNPAEFAELHHDAKTFSRDWHRQEAEAAELAREWFAVDFHLTQLLNLETKDTARRNGRVVCRDLLIRRGKARAEQRQWSLAGDDFSEAIMKYKADDSTTLSSAALTHFRSGDFDGYRKFCEQLLSLYSPSAHGEMARNLAWIALLDPDPKPGMENTLPELAKKSSQGRTDGLSEPLRQIAEGAAWVRKADHAKGIKLLEEGQILAEGTDLPRAWLFLAIASAKSMSLEEALKWQHKANRWIEFNCDIGIRGNGRGWKLSWMQRLELECLKDQVAKTLTAVKKTEAMPKLP